jgi:hypothetical protein
MMCASVDANTQTHPQSFSITIIPTF